MEDLSVQYDNTVRNTSGEIVQFIYGDDGLDPAEMEANGPVEIPRLLASISVHTKLIRTNFLTISQARYPLHSEEALLPYEILELLERYLSSPKFLGTF